MSATLPDMKLAGAVLNKRQIFADYIKELSALAVKNDNTKS